MNMRGALSNSSFHKNKWLTLGCFLACALGMNAFSQTAPVAPKGGSAITIPPLPTCKKSNDDCKVFADLVAQASLQYALAKDTLQHVPDMLDQAAGLEKNAASLRANAQISLKDAAFEREAAQSSQLFAARETDPAARQRDLDDAATHQSRATRDQQEADQWNAQAAAEDAQAQSLRATAASAQANFDYWSQALAAAIAAYKACLGLPPCPPPRQVTGVTTTTNQSSTVTAASNTTKNATAPQLTIISQYGNPTNSVLTTTQFQVQLTLPPREDKPSQITVTVSNPNLNLSSLRTKDLTLTQDPTNPNLYISQWIQVTPPTQNRSWITTYNGDGLVVTYDSNGTPVKSTVKVYDSPLQQAAGNADDWVRMRQQQLELSIGFSFTAIGEANRALASTADPALTARLNQQIADSQKAIQSANEQLEAVSLYWLLSNYYAGSSQAYYKFELFNHLRTYMDGTPILDRREIGHAISDAISSAKNDAFNNAFVPYLKVTAVQLYQLTANATQAGNLWVLTTQTTVMGEEAHAFDYVFAIGGIGFELAMPKAMGMAVESAAGLGGPNIHNVEILVTGGTKATPTEQGLVGGRGSGGSRVGGTNSEGVRAPVLPRATEIPHGDNIAPSVQNGPTCSAYALADCMRSYGEEVTGETVLAAAWQAVMDDPVGLRSGPEGLENMDALQNGKLTDPVAKAAMEKLGFKTKVVRFSSIESLKSLADADELMVIVWAGPNANGKVNAVGTHSMRVIDVDVASGKVILGNTHPTRIPGQEGGQIVKLDYDTFVKQTSGTIPGGGKPALLVRPKSSTFPPGGEGVNTGYTPQNPLRPSLPARPQSDTQQQNQSSTPTISIPPTSTSTSTNRNTNSGTAQVAVVQRPVGFPALAMNTPPATNIAIATSTENANAPGEQPSPESDGLGWGGAFTPDPNPQNPQTVQLPSDLENLTTDQSGSANVVQICLQTPEACSGTFTDDSNHQLEIAGTALAEQGFNNTTTSTGHVELASLSTTDIPPFGWPGAIVRMVPLFSSLSANDSPSISLISNGNSTGQSFVMQMVDRSGEVKDVALPEGTVLQPLKRDSKKEIAQKASTAARHMLTQNVSAFCLEYAKLPPEAGMFYRVADKALQEQYKPLISYIKAGRKLFSDGKFQPDSKPDQYATSIMQFTIWALIGHWDEKSFAQMFLERTKKNAEANGVKWTKEMENAILAAAPGRWRDISQVVALGNEMGTKAEVTHAVPATTATAITPRLDQP